MLNARMSADIDPTLASTDNAIPSVFKIYPSLTLSQPSLSITEEDPMENSAHLDKLMDSPNGGLFTNEAYRGMFRERNDDERVRLPTVNLLQKSQSTMLLPGPSWRQKLI